MKSFKKNLLYVFVLLFLTPGCNQEPKDYLHESQKDTDKRMEWWRDAGFGMFIHWGIYSVPAGIYQGKAAYAEWIMNQAHIPKEEYEKYAEDFNPVKFNAKYWVKLAKDAGMEYIVITSKHHDGFCMWDSKVSDYDIIDRTPYKKDVLKALSKACKKEGIRLCFYHSIMDWHHPDAKGENFPKYREEYLKPQLKELLTNYGDIGVLWFDGEWIEEWTEDQGRDLYNYLRNIKPDLIINNRVGKGRSGMQGMNAYEDAVGDFGTPEQEILEGTSHMDWESCMTMNNHWGYASYDKNFKSAEMLIHNLVDIAAKGGNYLLNIGPTSEGLFPEESIERLEEMGDWMKVNGEVIHKSRGVKNYRESENLYDIKSKDGKWIYAITTAWPGETLTAKYLVPEENSKVTLLGYSKPLKWKKLPGTGIQIQIPASLQDPVNRPCKYAWVFKMKGKMAEVVNAPVIQVDGKNAGDKVLFTDQVTVILTSETPDAKILYTLDGKVPNQSSTVYEKPLVIDKSGIIRVIATKDGMADSQMEKIELEKITSFSSISIKNPYSPKYAAYGELTLGNGVTGSKNIRDGEWLGWEGADMDVIIDLGEVKPVHKVSINVLQNTGSWIFWPVSYKVEYSVDGKNYKKAGEMDDSEIGFSEGKNIKKLQIKLSGKKARYLHVYAKNIGVCPPGHDGEGKKAWLFVDEIMVE
jgi:alpha-L-fucosidase